MKHSKINYLAAGLLLLTLSAGRLFGGYVEYSAAVQADSPVNYWHLSESLASDPAVDVGSGGGTANNGAYVGGVTLQQPGPWAAGADGGDRAIHLNGVDGYVDVPANAENDFGTSDFTISMWLKKDSSANGPFVYNQRVDGSNFVSIRYFDNFSIPEAPLAEPHLILEAWKDDAEKIRVYGAPGLFNEETPGWHHIAFTVDRDDVFNTKLVVDGVDRTTLAFAISADDISEPAGLSLGRWSGDGLYFDGSIDEVALFHSALSESRLNEHYIAATTGSQAVPGDFDSDGDVDGADFVVWQTNFPTATGATLADGDADSDGDVDGADFVVWQTNFPTSPGSGAALVPEPDALLLCALGGLIGLATRRHR